MDHEHGTVCQPILEHQIRLCAPSSVISKPTRFSSSLHCCWQVGSAPFVRRRCDCLASSASFTNIQAYLLTYYYYHYYYNYFHIFFLNLTGLFSGDYSTLCRVLLRSPTEEPLGIAGERFFYRLMSFLLPNQQ